MDTEQGRATCGNDNDGAHVRTPPFLVPDDPSPSEKVI